MIRKLILLILMAMILSTLSAFATDDHWAQVDILYNSDVGGKIEPCG